MDKLTAEETKNKSDQRLDVKCRSGRVCVGAELWYGLGHCYDRWAVWSSDDSIRRPLSVVAVASKSSNKAEFLSAAHGHGEFQHAN